MNATEKLQTSIIFLPQNAFEVVIDDGVAKNQHVVEIELTKPEKELLVKYYPISCTNLDGK